jgi:hypothetical protein
MYPAVDRASEMSSVICLNEAYCKTTLGTAGQGHPFSCFSEFEVYVRLADVGNKDGESEGNE